MREPQPYSKHVAEAYKLGTYVDSKGQVWNRGMDGWFHDMPNNSVFLARHDDMVELINKEHPHMESKHGG